jgi:hypothetical protein
VIGEIEAFLDQGVDIDRPVFLLLAMTPERILRMKPQNLITGLPLVQIEAAS